MPSALGGSAYQLDTFLAGQSADRQMGSQECLAASASSDGSLPHAVGKPAAAVAAAGCTAAVIFCPSVFAGRN